MADEQVTETEAEFPEAPDLKDTPTEAPKDDGDLKDPPKADETDWKAEARKHEKRAKDNAKAAEELAKIKQSQMSQAEKDAAERELIAKERDEANAKAAVLEAAIEHGITDKKDLALLRKLPADQVEAFAQRLSADKKNAPAGPSGTEVKGAKQKAPLEQQIADATKAGDFERAIALKQQLYAK